MTQKTKPYNFINAYLIDEYANCKIFKKVRAHVEHMGDEVFEVASLRIDSDGTGTFLIEFEPVHAFNDTSKILTIDEITREFEKVGMDNSELQQFVTEKYHTNIEKMNITSIIGLLSSRYLHVTNNFGAIAVDFPSERRL